MTGLGYASTLPVGADCDSFAACYPLRQARFTHDLSSHPLLSLDALAQAAMSMNPAHVECRRATTDRDAAFPHLDRNDQDIAEIIRNIDTANCWVMLRFAEQLPKYRQLLHDTLAPIMPIVAARTGPMRDLRAFIFISSERTLTPFHFDPEYNILFQVSGNKRFTLFPPEAPYLTDASQMRLYRDGDNLLGWDESYAADGVDNHLVPGDALYVPFKAPHRVLVEQGVSISISMTWKSDWSLAQDEAHRFNLALHRLGMRPRPTPGWPDSAHGKSIGMKLLRRIGLSQ